MELTEGVMEKVLSGCLNLECLDLCEFWGIDRLKISSMKLRKLIVQRYHKYGFLEWNVKISNENNSLWLKTLEAPYIQNLQLVSYFGAIHLQQRNVPSLVSAVLNIHVDCEDEDYNLEKEYSYLKELLQNVAHVKNLELSPWFIQCLSTLAMKGWQSPPSSRKFLKLNTRLERLDFLGIYSFLQSSWELETLVIDWNNHKPTYVYKKDKRCKRFEIHDFNCSLVHLKAIKFINMVGPLSENKFVLPLIKYLLENATVLEKFIIADRCKGSHVSRNYVKMEQKLLSFPRSSPHVSVLFSYGPSLY